METLALDVILQHPEYHAALDDPERTRDKDYLDESNPFLHMSLHVALESSSRSITPASPRAGASCSSATATGTRRCTRRSSAWRRRCGRAARQRAADAQAYLECLAARALRR